MSMHSVLFWNMDSSVVEDTVDADVGSIEATEAPVEVIEESSETEADTAAVDDTEDKIEEIGETTEQMFRNLDRANAIAHYIRRNGVDRQLMILQDYDGFISRGLRISVPSMESLGTRGDPYSRLSYAALEGIGDAAKSVWEWIKKMCRKIREFFQELWVKFLNIFSNYKKQIARLRAILKKRKDKNKDDVESVTISGWEVNNTNGDDIISQAVENVEKGTDKNKVNFSGDDENKKALNDIKDKLNDIDWSLDDLEVDNAISKANAALSKAESYIDDFKKQEKNKKAIDRVTKEIERDATARERSEGAATTPPSSASTSASGDKSDAKNSSSNNALVPVGNSDEDPNGAKQNMDGKALRDRASALNIVSQLASKLVGVYRKKCAIYIKTASGYISKGTVSRS